MLIKSLQIYRRWISPCLVGRCRFFPSCSCYWMIAIQRFGVIKGLFLGIRRLLRCHPGSPGGEDPVPE